MQDKSIHNNLLFVGYKSTFISSNHYLKYIKRRFGIKKLGYSGTLDPFASGTLVLASGEYTRILHHLKLSPKIYRATLWLGASSEELDISSNNISVNMIDEFNKERLCDVLESFIGCIKYTPPKFSAKKINGIRAYKLARENKEFVMSESEMNIFDIKLLSYTHPFLSFEVSVSKGSYIRSLGTLIANKLGVSGILSNLIRIREGDFIFDGYKMLNPLDMLKYECINIESFRDDFLVGRNIILPNICKNRRYIAKFDDFFSIIDIDENNRVKYIVNRIARC